MEDFESDSPTREFEELDEKLPMVAKVIVKRNINFDILLNDVEGEDETLEEFEEKQQACRSIYAILKELIECTSEMTADELNDAFQSVLVACELVSFVNSGIAKEENGTYSLTPDGQKYFDEMEDLEEN